jgi:two-component system, OmpR family, response regulator MtrA
MKKILFIEDDLALQHAVSQVLGQGGYEIVSATDGERGLGAVKEEKPDLILLDLILPKKDGFAVLAELKGNPDTKGIPVIVLTNLEASADVERVLEAGATTYLVKTNYRLEEIVQKIRGILGE